MEIHSVINTGVSAQYLIRNAASEQENFGADINSRMISKKDVSFCDHPVESCKVADVYARLIGQLGNDDDPNDIVPDMLVRMKKATDNGLHDNLQLIIRQNGISKFYSADAPLGGRLLENTEFVTHALHIDLDEDEKGDSMYCKILAGVHGVEQSEVSDGQIAALREHIATFVRNHPDLAEDANQALENDPLYGLEPDEAIDVYNNTPHEDRIYYHQPTRPWLEALVYLLCGVYIR